MDSRNLDRKFERKNIVNIQKLEAEVGAIYDKNGKIIAYELSRYKIKNPESFTWKTHKAYKKRVGAVIGGMNHDLTDVIEKRMVNGWSIANQKNNILASQYLRQFAIDNKQFPNYFNSNLNAMSEWINRSINGLTISENIWKQGDQIMEMLEGYVGSGIMEGKSSIKLAGELKQFLKDPKKVLKPGMGKYKSPYQNALRLARTETNMAYRASDMMRYRQLDFVVGYNVQLSAQHPVWDICDEMKGRYPKSFQFVGWHPNCFCYVTSILLEQDKFKQYLKDGNIPGSSYVIGLSGNKVKYIKNVAPKLNKYKNPPYWYKNNQALIAMTTAPKTAVYNNPLFPKDFPDLDKATQKKTGLTTPIPKAKPAPKTEKIPDTPLSKRWDKDPTPVKDEGLQKMYKVFDKDPKSKESFGWYKAAHPDIPLPNQAPNLKGYTAGEHRRINKHLRGIQKSTDDEFLQGINGIVDEFNKFPNWEGTTFRGMDLIGNGDAMKKFLKYKPGDLFVDQGFMSTSVCPTQAFSGNIKIRVEGRSGKFIGQYSEFKGEREVLFNPGSKWRIKEIDIDRDYGDLYSSNIWMTIAEL